LTHALSPESEQVSVTFDRVLDTAAELFWAKGYAATTTREIAAALEIQQASLYYHVSSKEDLLYQLCRSGLRQVLDAVEELPPTGSAIERVRVLARRHVTKLLGHKKRNAVMLMELRSLSPRHRSEVVALRQQYADVVRKTLEDAQAEGSIRNDISAGHLTLALLNMLNWTVVWFRADRELGAGELADLFIRIYLEGIATKREDTAHWMSLNCMPGTKGHKPVSRARKTGGAETSERLLKAAVALFSRKGYESTSTREVAALIGIQKASLYYHIESKEDLLYLISKASLECIRGDVEKAMQHADGPVERIRALIGAHLQSMLRDQEEHATTLAKMRSLSKERLAQVGALRRDYEEMVRHAMLEGQRAGAVRGDIDPKYMSLALLGLLNRVLVWYRKRGRLSPAQLGQVLGTIFLTGAAALPTGR
jgi:TetR/AcrR family transcriptional regulator, cholesterol catabolism regulator